MNRLYLLLPFLIAGLLLIGALNINNDIVLMVIGVVAILITILFLLYLPFLAFEAFDNFTFYRENKKRGGLEYFNRPNRSRRKEIRRKWLRDDAGIKLIYSLDHTVIGQIFFNGKEWVATRLQGEQPVGASKFFDNRYEAIRWINEKSRPA